MRFDAPELARAWLAVSIAASTNRADKILYKTIVIEEYDDGVRLVATDRTLVLTCWVPETDCAGAPAPGIGDAPLRTVICNDRDGRARSMLAFLNSLAARINADDYIPGQVAVELVFDVRVHPGTGVTATPTLEGMAPTYVVLESRDVEKVYLEVVEAAYVEWRAAFDGFQTHKVSSGHFNPEQIERLGKVGKHATGPIVLTFSDTGPVAVHYRGSDPVVRGLLMPAEERDPSATECEVCASGSICLRHASGLITASGIGSSLREGESITITSPSQPDASVTLTGATTTKGTR